jgi:hypothetical protein
MGGLTVDTGAIRHSAHEILALGSRLADIASALQHAASACSGASPSAFSAPSESLSRFVSSWSREAQLEANSCTDLASLMLGYANAMREADVRGASDLEPR